MPDGGEGGWDDLYMRRNVNLGVKTQEEKGSLTVMRRGATAEAHCSAPTRSGGRLNIWDARAHRHPAQRTSTGRCPPGTQSVWSARRHRCSRDRGAGKCVLHLIRLFLLSVVSTEWADLRERFWRSAQAHLQQYDQHLGCAECWGES